MNESEKLIHRRLIYNSTPLYEMLLENGFVEIKSEGQYLRKIRKFQKKDKFVYTSEPYGIMLLIKLPIRKQKTDDKQIFFDGLTVVYRGMSIHDQQLLFFANRNPVVKLENQDKKDTI